MSELTTCADECGSWLHGECDCGANASRLRARITDLEAQLAAKDALIREMVGAAKGVSGALNAAFAAGTEEREGGSGSRQGKYIDKYEAVRKATNAALTRAKEMGYE